LAEGQAMIDCAVGRTCVGIKEKNCDIRRVNAEDRVNIFHDKEVNKRSIRSRSLKVQFVWLLVVQAKKGRRTGVDQVKGSLKVDMVTFLLWEKKLSCES
jgi:hypothetical protein